VSDVGENNRRAINETAGCNRTGQGIFDGSMRGAGAHAALLTATVGFQNALRQPARKQ